MGEDRSQEAADSPGGGLASLGAWPAWPPGNRQGYIYVCNSPQLRGCIRLSKNMISTLDGSETDPPNVASYVRPRFKLSPSEVGLLASALTNMFD